MSRRRSSSRGRYRGHGSKRGNGRNNKSNINITAFIQKSQEVAQSEAVDVTVNRLFNDLNLRAQLQKNIANQGFTEPTPIQDRVFDQIMMGRNVLGIANTGTGKTGAFLIPTIEKLLTDESEKFLVITPTRELAVQIQHTFVTLAKGTHLRAVQCIGGSNITKQIYQLSRNHHAVIGTPGRIKDLATRGKLDLSQFKVVVLDEVDRMLDMGFVHVMREILAETPSNRQGLYFSATIARSVSRLINEFSTDVYEVSVKTAETAVLVEQEVIKYEYQEKKLDMLHDVLMQKEVLKVLIFGRTKRGVTTLTKKLRERGFKTDAIHGNKSQSQRQRALTAFRKNKVSILVATDVAARGLDIDDVSHVINYEIPDTYDDYVHRIGRTGRGGKKGVAYTFVK